MTLGPVLEEIFEMTLSEEVDPIQMVASDGWNASEWTYDGSRLSVPQTRRFKLVKVGFCKDLNIVRKELARHGEIPGGLWCNALSKAHSILNSMGSIGIGIADPSWVDEYGDRRFPYMDNFQDNPTFGDAGDEFIEEWDWLVFADE